jgi:hypothetical protein
MEPESPSPYPQVPATCPYPEPTPSSPHDSPSTSWISIISDPALYRLLTFHVPSNMSLFRLRLRDTSSRNTPPFPPEIRLVEWFTSGLFCLQRKHLNLWVILNMCFYREGLLAPRPAPKLEDHPSSAVRGCLFNLFTATLHIGGRSSIRNLRTRHAMVTGTHIHG